LKIAVHYFTGTGNTARAVAIMSGLLLAAGHEVRVLRVRRGSLPPEGRFDLQVFAFCVLSWSAPVMMKHYLRSLPRIRGHAGGRAALLAVNGGMMVKGNFRKGYSGQALEQAEGILRRRGYEVFLTDSASFPENWTQFVNPLGATEVEAALPLGEEEVKGFVRRLLAGEAGLFRAGLVNRIWSGAVAFIFGCIGRRLLGKAYIADERCTACGLCAATCPAGTIRMHGRQAGGNGRLPRWGAACEDCNRCINICPEAAIQVSLPLLFLHIAGHAGLTIGAIRIFTIHLPELVRLSPPLQAVLTILFGLAAVYICLWVELLVVDPLLQLLARLPGLRRFFLISRTRGFRRYTAPGFKPAAKE